MKIPQWLNSILIISASIFSPYCYGQEAKVIKNIVLVHGAFVDGSGWEEIYNILTRQRFKVSVTQHTCTSYNDDVAAVNTIIDSQEGLASW